MSVCASRSIYPIAHTIQLLSTCASRFIGIYSYAHPREFSQFVRHAIICIYAHSRQLLSMCASRFISIFPIYQTIFSICASHYMAIYQTVFSTCASPYIYLYAHTKLFCQFVRHAPCTQLPILDRLCQLVRHAIYTHMSILESFDNLCVTIYIHMANLDSFCQFVRNAICTHAHPIHICQILDSFFNLFVTLYIHIFICPS